MYALYLTKCTTLIYPIWLTDVLSDFVTIIAALHCPIKPSKWTSYFTAIVFTYVTTLLGPHQRAVQSTISTTFRISLIHSHGTANRIPLCQTVGNSIKSTVLPAFVCTNKCTLE